MGRRVSGLVGLDIPHLRIVSGVSDSEIKFVRILETLNLKRSSLNLIRMLSLDLSLTFYLLILTDVKIARSFTIVLKSKI